MNIQFIRLILIPRFLRFLQPGMGVRVRDQSRTRRSDAVLTTIQCDYAEPKAIYIDEEDPFRVRE
jgi:hypothetical protein